MTITTTSVLPAPVQQSFSYKLLAVPTPQFIFKTAAMLKQMPRNGGTVMRMRRFNPLPVSTVPLGNSGVTPPPVQLTALDIDAKIEFYGQYLLLNEQVTLQNQDPVLNEAAMRLGVSLKQTDDQLTRDMLAATASFINCVNGTDGDLPTEITRPDIDITIRALVGANAYTIMENIEGEDRFGTGPVRDAYMMYSHTDIIPDLERVTGFIPKAQYPSPMHALRAEWGSVSNFRTLVTSVGSETPQASLNGNTVYNNFCMGLEAYTVIEQDGYSAQFIYRPPVYDGPLALNASVGWKMANARAITQDTWMINLRSTISFPTN